MTRSLAPAEQLAELFRRFSRQAWRWECQGTYREPDESEAWSRWKAGETDDFAWLRPWLDHVQEATRSGRSFARVRVFAEPPTEYQRWQLEVSPANIAAGEDLRVLNEGWARTLALPEHDFWLFDDELVAVMHFEDEQFSGLKMLSSPGQVDRYRRWKAIAWHHAMSFDRYVQLRSP